ncbi:lipoyl(octanoyl) transferase LipB [Acinetobacter sp. A3.8]|uniref:Octanoyltransferase n=1 Tax=Acinetobacter sedimenti TaxID=2919922 RepID=A0A9X1WYK8_9GAMM|nr:lipoyl(octanoyl) transferase LipB [Acinetobacter sedimenti]MCJ8145865.1 lipoyl(octanoyl) transferase LipB [Acinetobacter sedimenti]
MQNQPQLIVRTFRDLQDYTARFEAMKSFTEQRALATSDANIPDELWLLQHHDVLTQGQAGKPEHILIHSDIPIVQSDRGGQVTWHGRGQLIAYFLFDLNRLKWHVRDLVNFAEEMMLWILQQYGIEAYTKKDAPGVYVAERKIGSLGFKIRRGCSYHGLSLNVDCDLTGFQTINPCGYAGLEMVRLSDLLDIVPSFADLYQKCQQFITEKQIFANILIEADQ